MYAISEVFSVDRYFPKLRLIRGDPKGALCRLQGLKAIRSTDGRREADR